MSAALTFPFGENFPTPGETVELVPGLRWLRMPLPSSLRHVNLWLLDDGDACSIVDCGIATPALKELWSRILARMARKPVRQVIATHMHSDHVGLARWLCDRLKAEFRMSAEDYRSAQLMRGATAQRFGDESAEHLVRHGVTAPDLISRARAQPTPYPELVPDLPVSFKPIGEGNEVTLGGRIWRAIATQGHTTGHLSFYCPSLGVVIAGDMLLPSISPYVGVSAMNPEANPLPQFLDSLDRFLDLPDHTLVLPSHGLPFRGIAARVAQLKSHHQARLELIRECCRAAPRCAAELIPLVFHRSLDPRQFALALGEVLAHTNALQSAGALTQIEQHGVVRVISV